MDGTISMLAPIAKRLAGKVALITGGASGIGESTARLFAEHSAKVIIADIQDELGFSICQDKSTHGAISYVHCDVTSESDVQNAINTVLSKHGKLDIMFSNAGCLAQADANILAFDPEEYKKVFDVNVWGSMLVAKHAAKVMIPEKKGTIIFTASSVTQSQGMGSHTYTVSKHALGIRVNCISPFVVATPMCLKWLGMDKKERCEEIVSTAANLKGVVLEATDVAEAALFLGSEESKYVSGFNLVVDGGFSVTNIALPETIRKLFN
ncbi:hypothetical protein CIPAW_14G086700 [Carya illinoinensis]|uniref:Uncharacterized protein n=1 Tax=Carya illinoinensis TaxID=32201 RepID=A0A8T1NKN2_CARIL|nr:hypothetical protein CIPAW_14G086700 [Carya illinoinensis]